MTVYLIVFEGDDRTTQVLDVAADLDTAKMVAEGHMADDCTTQHVSDWRLLNVPWECWSAVTCYGSYDIEAKEVRS